MIAFLYPGQASQYVGMLKDLVETYPVAAEMVEQADEILDFDLKNICFNGPEDKLKQTYITQPAIFVHSCVATRLLADSGIKPDFVAGHSLGEYSSLVAAGAIEFLDALKLVKIRGDAMQKAGEIQPGTMAAIIGMDDENVAKLCAAASDAGIVTPANFNSPGQIVISGSLEGIAKAVEIAAEFGAKRAVPLVVGGAFHSPLMESAGQSLKEAIHTSSFKNAHVPVYSNVKAEPVQDAEEIKELLEQQLTSPVLWSQSMENMVRDGAETFYEVGPQRVLAGLLRRIDRKKRVKGVDTVEDLNNLSAN
ncbi:MAG: [acyl-carrier-protein] S-malonyltransferase [Calditrichaeota bacterium]|nr:MAG: [acyl-carrier-protein] S-malonyltransferase [Calditrichota bacterium]